MQVNSTIKTLFQENRLFFHLMVMLFTVGMVPLFLFDKVTIFIMVKQWNHPIIDQFVYYFTHIGNGITYVCLLLLMSLWGVSYKSIAIMAGSFVCTAVWVQILKRVLFPTMLRPAELIPIHLFHTVQGVSLEQKLSFPSGHAATIFTLIWVIQLLFIHKNKLYSFMLLLTAVTVSYSRIYLCQHFYTDVYVGALIGTLSTLGVYFCLNQYHRLWYWLGWLDYLLRCIHKYTRKALSPLVQK